MQVIPECPNCRYNDWELYYQLQRNNTLHLIGKCNHCKTVRHLPRMDNLKIPTYKTEELQRLLKVPVQKSSYNGQTSIFNLGG